MCRHATTALPPEPRSASAARRFVADRLQEWGLEALRDDALLAVTELVTNAVLHARTPLLVCVSSENRQVEIAVFDGNETLPQPRPPRDDLARDLADLLAQEAAVEDSAGMDERDPRLDVGPAGTVTGGRGLLLVAALAAEWGVSPLSDGKAVWVRTPAPAGWSPSDPCPCASAVNPAKLGSGRPVVDVG